MIAIRLLGVQLPGAPLGGGAPVIETRAAHLGHLADGREGAAAEAVAVIHVDTLELSSELSSFLPLYSADPGQVFRWRTPLISPVSSSS
jgi:hypothetical protein